MELKVRDLLTEYGFPGEQVPVVAVSGLLTLQGDPHWAARISDLPDAVDLARCEGRLPDHGRSPDILAGVDAIAV